MVYKISGVEIVEEIGSWKVNLLFPKSSSLPDVQKHLPFLFPLIEKTMENWQRQKEPTLVWERFGLPSLILRIDYTLDEEGKPLIYEVEERPAGIGIAFKFVPNFKELFSSLGWEKTIVVVSPARKKRGDDYLWAETFSPNEIPSEGWIIGRFEPSELDELDEKIYHSLSSRSISTLRTKGWKGYGIDLFWEKISDFNFINQIFNEIANKRKWPGFCLKCDGSKANNDVKIWVTRKTRKEIKKFLGRETNIGTWSPTKMREFSLRANNLYLQRFFPPLKVSLNGKNAFGILRIFFGYDLNHRKWKLLGGFLNVRESLLVHGANDAFLVVVPPI